MHFFYQNTFDPGTARVHSNVYIYGARYFRWCKIHPIPRHGPTCEVSSLEKWLIGDFFLCHAAGYTFIPGLDYKLNLPHTRTKAPLMCMLLLGVILDILGRRTLIVTKSLISKKIIFHAVNCICNYLESAVRFH